MPDNALSNPIASLYPQPPQQNNNSNALLNDPAKVIGLMRGIQDYRLKQQQFDALSQQPQATLDNTNIANQTAMMQQQAAASRATSSLIGSYLAGNPNPTADDVRDAKAFAARSLPNVATQYPDMIPAAGDVVLKHPKGIKFGAGTLLNSQLSPDSASTLVEGTPNPATGAARKITVPESNLTGGRDVALPPGDQKVLEANKEAYTAAQERSAVTQANLRKLETAYPLVQQLSSANFGPGSAEFAKLKGALTTAGIIDPNTSDLKVRQEVGKYLLNYAQGAANAGRSDHALSSAIGSNPNLDLVQPANLALIRNQIGMDKADASIPVLFKQQHPNVNDKASFNDFQANFYRDYDPRAYTYDKMSGEERRELIDSLGAKNSPAYQKFAKTYNQLKRANFVTPNGQ
jgi:hypothetical protein